MLRVRDNFAGRIPSWNRSDVRKAGAAYEVAVKAGEVIEASIGGPGTTSAAGSRR